MDQKQQLLRRIPSMSDLLASPAAQAWACEHGRALVAHCVRQVVEDLRQQILQDTSGRCGLVHVTQEHILTLAGQMIAARTRPHIRPAVNATGIILHTGLGRAVLPAGVVDSMTADLKGYVTLAVDRQSGERSERDQRLEYILTELTGAEAATVVNNNAAATVLVLVALAAGREAIVSRGQLIEIGGSFRLPEVMAQSGARMVEVGTTNRTHLVDYAKAVTENTAVIMRVHPSNYRIVGFTAEVALKDLAELARSRGLTMLDDLGAGALVDLAQFGLPHEPTVQQSIADGADVVIFSADKLIGGPQGGIIVGRRELIERIRRHPLARAFRVDKTQLMGLERTLMLFRDIGRLRREHPLYRTLSTPKDALARRAEALAEAIRRAAPSVQAEPVASQGYLGSGSLPTEALASWAVLLSAPQLGADELARRLRMDEACVFGRVQDDKVVLDVLTILDEQVPAIAGAVERAVVATVD